jgi:hypothetical protein
MCLYVYVYAVLFLLYFCLWVCFDTLQIFGLHLQFDNISVSILFVMQFPNYLLFMWFGSHLSKKKNCRLAHHLFDVDWLK